jgi:hypothetical protein
MAQQVQTAVHLFDDPLMSRVGCPPRVERRTLASAGFTGLQQRHPLRRLIDHRVVRPHACIA